MEDKCKECRKKLFAIYRSGLEQKEKPNRFQCFALGFSIATLISVLFAK